MFTNSHLYFFGGWGVQSDSIKIVGSVSKVDQVYSHSETEPRSCRVIKKKNEVAKISAVLSRTSLHSVARPARSLCRIAHTDTDHAVARSSTHHVVAAVTAAVFALAAAAPRGTSPAGLLPVFRVSSSSPTLVLVLRVASWPTSSHTGRKPTSAPLVCTESSTTSERNKYRVDGTASRLSRARRSKQNWA
jgi:hypothetical protein